MFNVPKAARVKKTNFPRFNERKRLIRTCTIFPSVLSGKKYLFFPFPRNIE